MAREPKHFVQSLSRGLGILQAFNADQPRLTLTKLSQITGMNKTAVQRFTDTLMTLGYLGRNQYKEFYLGPRVLTLGFAYLDGSELRQLAADQLQELSHKVGGTVNLGVLDGVEVVLLSRVEVQTFFKLALRPGSRLPAHCTALGKVLLAGLEPWDLAQRLEVMELAAITERTITATEELKAELELTRRRGYAISDREVTPASYSTAAPVLDRRGQVTAAVAFALSIEEARGERVSRGVQELLTVCRSISERLGYQGIYPTFGI